MIVAGNKCDLTSDEAVEDFRKFVEARGYAFFPIMAAIRYGVDPLLSKIEEMLSKLPPIARFEAQAVEKPQEDSIGRREVTITNEGGVYVVEGEWLLGVMRTVSFDDYESLQYFERVLTKSGVIDALREAGCGEGDTVSIYDVEFDFME